MALDGSQRPPSFQEIILRLQSYWADQGCVILQPYDLEVGAGTFHTATTLRALGPESWNAAYVQPFDHLKLPFNVLAGFYVFGWVPGGNLWLGAALIIAASLYIAHRESKSQEA